MKKSLFSSGCVFSLLLVLLWSSGRSSRAADDPAEKPGAAPKALVFAITPWKDPELIKSCYEPMMEYIRRTVGVQAVFLVARDYEELGDRIVAKAADVGFFTPAAYVKAQEKIPGLKYVATVLGEDKQGNARDFYRGIVLTLKESGYRTLGDLKGKKFGFTDYQSASGYVYPRSFLLSEGIVPENYFSQIFMLKKHSKILAALVNRSIDAGATYDVNYTTGTEEYGDVFHVVAETLPIPFDAFAAGPHVPDEVIRSLRSALLKLSKDSPAFSRMNELGTTYRGFTVRDDDFYDVVREAYGSK